jgi:tRNA isopentenyl-2-thiomethyl-A-37 hydroxylase MiaE
MEISKFPKIYFTDHAFTWYRNLSASRFSTGLHPAIRNPELRRFTARLKVTATL